MRHGNIIGHGRTGDSYNNDRLAFQRDGVQLFVYANVSA